MTGAPWVRVDVVTHVLIWPLEPAPAHAHGLSALFETTDLHYEVGLLFLRDSSSTLLFTPRFYLSWFVFRSISAETPPPFVPVWVAQAELGRQMLTVSSVPASRWGWSL